MLALELLSAVVGAGLASGREIASFYAEYGWWGLGGIALTALTMLALGGGTLPSAWQGRWPERLWRGLLRCLLITTGGAMLCSTGHLAALTLPVHGAYWLGMAGSLVLAWRMALSRRHGLAWTGCGLVCLLMMMVVAGFPLPPMRAAFLSDASVWEAAVRAVSYGGFSAALQYPVLAARPHTDRKERYSAIAVLTLLLAAGFLLLMRHPALIGEPMPFVRMMQRYGKPGFWLCALCLYLASLTTLATCLRGIRGKMPDLAAMGLICLLGFEGVVGRAYPLIGSGCMILLAWAKMAKMRNSFR